MKKWVDSNQDSDRMVNMHGLQEIDEATRKDQYPIPFIDQTLDMLGGK